MKLNKSQKSLLNEYYTLRAQSKEIEKKMSTLKSNIENIVKLNNNKVELDKFYFEL